MEIEQIIRQIWPGADRINRIGHGSFGTVYRIQNGRQEYAVKVIRVPVTLEESHVYRQKREISEEEGRRYLHMLKEEYLEEVMLGGADSRSGKWRRRCNPDSDGDIGDPVPISKFK